MTINHCMHHARRIMAQPDTKWAGLINKLPDSCAYADCGEPRSCQQRLREYLRVQWMINRNLK
jgi:hypothetical protein